MNKKRQNIELKIYELLGIKFFKKMFFLIRDVVYKIMFLKKSKEELKDIIYNNLSNYNLGKGKNFEDIKNFKKKLFFNAGVHIIGLLLCIPDFIKVISGTAILSTTIINLTFIILNLYCIMLQRYNGIRINQLIEKMTPRYKKQLDKIKEELKKEDSLLCEHTYKLVNKKVEEKSITFEELIDNSSIKELKRYRSLLEQFNYSILNSNNLNEPKEDIRIPIQKNKTLKLELKHNKTNN